MIFVLFFSLSGAKVQFIVIVDNLTPKKLKKIVSQHRIFSLVAVWKKKVSGKYNKWDNEYPTQKTRNLFGKM